MISNLAFQGEIVGASIQIFWKEDFPEILKKTMVPQFPNFHIYSQGLLIYYINILAHENQVKYWWILHWTPSF